MLLFCSCISVNISVSRIYWKNSAASANQKVEKWTVDYHTRQTCSSCRTIERHTGT